MKDDKIHDEPTIIEVLQAINAYATSLEERIRDIEKKSNDRFQLIEGRIEPLLSDM